jgi:acyl-coenzyme A synthetase/AMP-(fatty) acid ligase
LQTTAPEIANVGELASRAARIHAKRLAVTSAQRSVTYEELEQRSNRLANALCGLGLQRGDRVGVYLPNCIEIVELELACYKAALVKAPINARLAPVEVAEVIANSDATLIVTTAERAEGFLAHLKHGAPRLLLLDAAENTQASYEGVLARASDRFTPVRVQPDELAVLHYTSGSTGKLKAAMQTVGNRMASLRKVSMGRMHAGPGDVLLLSGPITHASGMFIQPMLFQGATILLLEGFRPADYLAAIEKHRVTMAFLVPAMIYALLAEPSIRTRDLSSLRLMSYGAAPMSPARIREAWTRSARCWRKATAPARPPAVSSA